MRSLPLNNGVPVPQLGLGVWPLTDAQAYVAVSHALKAGYRHIDTAKVYDNEAGVGRAVRDSGVPRQEILLTSKLWNADQGYDAALRAFDAGLQRLGTDYVDLYLIHWPVPEQQLPELPGRAPSPSERDAQDACRVHGPSRPRSG